MYTTAGTFGATANFDYRIDVRVDFPFADEIGIYRSIGVDVAQIVEQRLPAYTTSGTSAGALQTGAIGVVGAIDSDTGAKFFIGANVSANGIYLDTDNDHASDDFTLKTLIYLVFRDLGA